MCDMRSLPAYLASGVEDKVAAHARRSEGFHIRFDNNFQITRSQTPIAIMASKANRRPTPEERKGLQVQIRRDIKLLNLLNEELGSRLQDQDVTAHALEAATFTLKQARFRLRTAQSHLNYVEASIKVLDGKFTYAPNPSDSSSPPAPALAPSLHSQAAEKIVNRHKEMLKEMRNWLEEATEEARDAKQAAAISEEDLECARNLHNFSKDIIPDIKQQIQAVESSLSQKRLLSRFIWDVPDEIWMEIFNLVTENDDPNSELQLYGTNLMILMSVCSSWRAVIYSNKALHARVKSWASIDELTIPKGVQDEARIFTSISYCFTGLTTLTIQGNVVDIIVTHLLKREDVSEGTKLTAFTVPLLTKLIVINYSGNGEELLRLADERHDALHSVKGNNAALERADRMSQDPNSSNSTSRFIEWYFQREGAGIPRPIVEQPVTGPHYAGNLYLGEKDSPLYTVCLYMGSRRLGMGYGSREEDAHNRCFRDAKSAVLEMNGTNSMWQEFITDVIAGRDGPIRLFKIELRHCQCQIIDSKVLRSLTPYTQQ